MVCGDTVIMFVKFVEEIKGVNACSAKDCDIDVREVSNYKN